MLAASSSRLCSRGLATAAKKRGLHDLTTTASRKPIVSYGPPGRSAVTGHTVTVFGSTGFLARYLISKIAKSGTRVIVPYRDEDEKRHLKVMGDLGQIIPLEWDLRNEQQTLECLRHSDTVYNLVGRNYETKNFDFYDVHVKGAESIARIAAENGVDNFIHVSHLNAAEDSPSQFYASKYEGELAVREAFPSSTIVRPGTLYGYEDRLLTNMARWPIWWKLNHGQTKIRPVHVIDVAQALNNLLTMPPLGRTISLPGPSTLTYQYLLELIASVTYQPISKAPVLPKPVAHWLAKGTNYVWWQTVCPDEVERRFIDDVDTPGDWDLVDVVPDEIETFALKYLRMFRSGDNYARPLVLPRERPFARLINADVEIEALSLTGSKSVASSSSSALESHSEESDSSSSSSTSSESESDSDSELGEVSQEYLNSLLEKAKEELRARAQEKGKGKERAFGEEEDEIRLGDEQEDDAKELPQLEPGSLPPGYFDFKDSDTKKPPELRDIDAERLDGIASSSSGPAATPAPPELGKDGRKLAKKEKKQLKKRTAGPQWFDLPAPDSAELPRLYREVEALRLRNAMDPKRFYRREPGEGKGIKGLPEYFAIGTIVTTSTPFGTTSGDNLPRIERKRNLVDELVADSEAKRYAKRKFEDLQKVRGARGRGTLAKRFGSRKSKW
ncbi:EFM5 [Sanghuangporus vaninii]